MRRRAIAAVLWAYSAAHFALSGVRQPLRNFSGDFLASWPSWRLAVLLGRTDLYRRSLAARWALKFTPRWAPRAMWSYGPVEHLLTLPLFLFADRRQAYVAWLIANYVFVLAIFAVGATLFDWRGRRWIAAVCALNFLPLYEALAQRVIEIFELLLIVAAFALLRRGREGWCGVLIGIAAMTKFLPLIFMPYFAVRRKWRALAGALLAIAPLAAAAEIVFGWRDSSMLLQLRRGGFLNEPNDQSLAGMLVRLLRWTHAPLSAYAVCGTAMAFALGALTWLFLRYRADDDIEWSTLIAAMVLLPPHNQNYYFVLLLFPYGALLARRIRLPWLAVSYALVGAPLPMSLLSRLLRTDAFVAYLYAGVPFIGAAILLVLSGMSHAVGDGGSRTPWPSRRPSPTLLPS